MQAETASRSGSRRVALHSVIVAACLAIFAVVIIVTYWLHVRSHSHAELLAHAVDVVTKLAALISDLDAGKGTAGKLLKDETLYNNANHMLEETQGLIKAIRENPKKYLSIKLHIF